MKEKALFSTLLLCMAASAIFMFVIYNSIESMQSRSVDIGPGGFNALLQMEHGLNTYAIALEEYRNNIGNPDEERRWAKQYQHEFDILWGNLSQFSFRFIDTSETENLLTLFRQEAQLFLSNTEPAMLPSHVLTEKSVTVVLNDLRSIQQKLHDVGQDYFFIWLTFRDNWVTDLKQLHLLLLFFSGMLVIASCLLVAFLIRSNLRKNTLISEADSARTALSSTVSELRSGRREQRAKDSFIAAASHDLRQPLHALGLFLGSLDRHVQDDEGRATLHEAIQCSNNLGALFNSLLDLSRLDAGIVKVVNQHFELQKLTCMLQQEFQTKCADMGVKIVVNVQDAVVESDPILLSRIIRNLIENALIHSGADTITITCTEKNNSFLLTVSDNGRGIAESEQQHVFNEYYQIKNRPTNAEKGLGLGLSIVKRLSELLDMRVVLHSELGKSTSFTMDIPAGDMHGVIEPQNDTFTTSNVMQDIGHIVAVVDDDERICVAMSTLLHSIGLDAVTATSADALIDKLIESEKMPSLIIADYRLEKGKTGDQAIVQLRRALNLDIPGLLITGDTAPIHVAEATKSGFELLHKPVQSVQLANKIYEVLSAGKSYSANDPEQDESALVRRVNT